MTVICELTVQMLLACYTYECDEGRPDQEVFVDWLVCVGTKDKDTAGMFGCYWSSWVDISPACELPVIE